jgi:hypothetical protein
MGEHSLAVNRQPKAVRHRYDGFCHGVDLIVGGRLLS